LRCCRFLAGNPDGWNELQGIWKAGNNAATDIQAFVEGGEIPYNAAAAEKKRENFRNRQTADPLASCYMPGVPRIMYLDYPFHIFQTRDHIAFTFEWSSVFRLIYLATSLPFPGVDSGWAIHAADGGDSSSLMSLGITKFRSILPESSSDKIVRAVHACRCRYASI
jgi:hypothetical protein